MQFQLPQPGDAAGRRHVEQFDAPRVAALFLDEIRRLR